MLVRRFLHFSWLKSIWTIMGSIAAGVVIGLFYHPFAIALIPYGDLYLSFLKMCVIPIMVTAIVSSIGRVFMSSGTVKLLKRMILVFIAGLIITGALGLTVGLIGKPGTGISTGSKSVLGEAVLMTELSSDAATDATAPSGLLEFLLQLVPSNIFDALGQGNNLQILFFCTIIGIAVGIVSSRSGEGLLAMTDLLFKAFQHVISWSMYALPFGLLCITAGQIAATGTELLMAMIKFVICIYAASITLMLISGWVISVKLKISFRHSLRGLKETLIIAFGTRNSIATMPSALEALRDVFKLNASTVNLVVPLGIVICRYSMVLIYTVGIVFIAQLYGVTLGIGQLFIALIGAVIAAIAGAGSPGMVSISMISLVAAPLHLPFSAGVILLMAVNPVIDPAVTVASVHANCAATVFIVGNNTEETLAPNRAPEHLSAKGSII